MANLLGQNIGTNYKGILSLDSTINTPLDATLRAVTDGEGNASPLELSTTAVSVGTISGARLGIKGSGSTSATKALLVQNSDGLELLHIDDVGGVRLGGNLSNITRANIALDSFSGLFNVTTAKFGNWNGSVYAVFSGLTKSDALFSFGNDATIASTRMHIKGIGTTSGTTSLLVQNSAGADLFRVLDGGADKQVRMNSALIGSLEFLGTGIATGGGNPITMQYNPLHIGGATGARLAVKGSGTTSATTSLLVQNSAGTDRFKILDNGTTTINGDLTCQKLVVGNEGKVDGPAVNALNFGAVKGFTMTRGSAFNGIADDSSIVEIKGTNGGFLPPRMTTTQKNAIATPASGLIVYDETTNKLACYNGTTWNDLF
jgi:hypothetical protein